jgi:imidazolonepropionase-like amidohydrolase
MFSAKDIIKIMTQNAAAVIGRSNQLGTLEPGQDQGHPRNPRLK